MVAGMGVDSETKIILAVLKGAVEHGDTSAYFGSLAAHDYYRNRTIGKGWLVRVQVPEHALYEPTEFGRRVYDTSGVGTLEPKTYGFRWMCWKGWNRVTEPGDERQPV